MFVGLGECDSIGLGLVWGNGGGCDGGGGIGS